MTTRINWKIATRPGFSEIAIALMTYLLLLVVISVVLFQIPDDHAALRGIVGMATNGVAGTVAFIAACILRIRNFTAFGFRAVSICWLVKGAGLGIVAVGLSLVIEHIYFLFITEPNTQGDFQAAAQAGPFMLLLLVFTGAVLTPFGEEVLFRGVIANALNRFGWWFGVVGSAAIFAIIHGPSVILLDAFMVGILTGILFRETRSIWPGFLLHAVYNGIWLIIYSLQ